MKDIKFNRLPITNHEERIRMLCKWIISGLFYLFRFLSEEMRGFKSRFVVNSRKVRNNSEN